MTQKRDQVVLLVVALILGLLVMRQLLVSPHLQKVSKIEEEQLLALEVARLIKANADLREEIQTLGETFSTYQKSLENRKEAEGEVQKNLQKYQVIAAESKVKGPGIEVDIEGPLSKEDFVDLINALKNIGAEAISVNGIRLTPFSYFGSSQGQVVLDKKRLDQPYRILAIGDSSLLAEALQRKGGVLDLIQAAPKEVKVGVEKRETVVLEAAEGRR